APTRAEALARLDRALAATHVLGVVTNTAFLRSLLALDEVREGQLDTGLIERHPPELTCPPRGTRSLAVAALVRWDRVARARPAGLWHASRGWRLGGQAPCRVRFAAADGGVRTVALAGTPAAARARVDDGAEHPLALHDGAVTVDGQRLPLSHHCTGTAVWIGLPGEDREL